jgi:hypothetical protein
LEGITSLNRYWLNSIIANLMNWGLYHSLLLAVLEGSHAGSYHILKYEIYNIRVLIH